MLTEEIRWEERADCTDRDPRIWDGEDEYLNGKAKGICRTCPVKDRCLIDAMVNELDRPDDERHTIRGAHSPQDRSGYKREFLEKFGRDLPLLKVQYRRRDISLGGRQEKRLEKSRRSRMLLHPGIPKYDEYRQLLDVVISSPEATAVLIGNRIGKSESWVNHTLMEVWEKVS